MLGLTNIKTAEQEETKAIPAQPTLIQKIGKIIFNPIIFPVLLAIVSYAAGNSFIFWYNLIGINTAVDTKTIHDIISYAICLYYIVLYISIPKK